MRAGVSLRRGVWSDHVDAERKAAAFVRFVHEIFVGFEARLCVLRRRGAEANLSNVCRLGAALSPCLTGRQRQ